MPAPHHPPSSSPDQPPQWFLFGLWTFDITAATAILRDAGPAPRSADQPRCPVTR